MSEGLLVWSAFGFCGLVVVITGPRLSRYGDAIAEKTGLGRSWIGIILLALVTSLPEVATSATAAWIGQPDLVFGNVFGSNLFNILVIALLDFFMPRPPFLERASRNNLLISSFGIKMMTLALIPLILYNLPGLGFSPINLFGLIDIASIIIIGIYIYGMRMIFLQEQQTSKETPTAPESEKYSGMSRSRCFGMFTFLALIIIASGICMSLLADIISDYEIPIGEGIPIGKSLVGIILLAIVTSLPELMVSIGAVKLGAIDMALGNVLGSNMFNMMILGVSDLFYSSGSIFERSTVAEATRIPGLGSSLVVGLAAIILLGIVSSKISYVRKMNRRISASSVAIAIIFLLTYFLLYKINFG